MNQAKKNPNDYQKAEILAAETDADLIESLVRKCRRDAMKDIIMGSLGKKTTVRA